MPRKSVTPHPPRQSPLLQDRIPLDALSRMPNDADDGSDAEDPTTDHDAQGWRAIPPAQP
jgi:hypothetical protein